MLGEDTLGSHKSQVLIGDEQGIRAVIDPMPYYVLMVDSEHRIVMANEALYATYQLTPDQVLGAFCPRLIHGLDGPFPGCPVELAHELHESVETELYDEAADIWMRSGAYLTDFITADGKPVYLHVVQDITQKKKADEELAQLQARLEETVAIRTAELERANQELQDQIRERERAEETIRQLAYYDGLTGLPNRVNFSGLLSKAMKATHRYGRRFAVALLDIDGLKLVNDTMGHDAGDRLLQLVSKRLEDALRGDDTAARMSGDEFLFILNEIGDSDDFGAIGERLLHAFQRPFDVYGTEVEITASIGGAVYPDDATDEDTLMKLADLAMYKAKRAGGNRFHRFRIDGLSSDDDDRF